MPLRSTRQINFALSDQIFHMTKTEKPSSVILFYGTLFPKIGRLIFFRADT